MTITKLLRGAASAAAVLALAAPAAHASDSSAPVCNQASPAFQGGALVAGEVPVDSPAARYTESLSPLPGGGVGLATAAAHAPALTACGAVIEVPGGWGAY